MTTFVTDLQSKLMAACRSAGLRAFRMSWLSETCASCASRDRQPPSRFEDNFPGLYQPETKPSPIILRLLEELSSDFDGALWLPAEHSSREIASSRGTPAVEAERAELCLDWVARRWLPAWLRFANADSEAALLERFPPVTWDAAPTLLAALDEIERRRPSYSGPICLAREGERLIERLARSSGGIATLDAASELEEDNDLVQWLWGYASACSEWCALQGLTNKHNDCPRSSRPPWSGPDILKCIRLARQELEAVRLPLQLEAYGLVFKMLQMGSNHRTDAQKPRTRDATASA